jgi:hypothetical protein
VTDYLTVVEALAIHEDQIQRYGVSAGIRDRGLLEAALFVFNDKGATIAPACRVPPPASCPASRMRSEVRRRPSEPPATLPRAEARLFLYNDAVVFVLGPFSQNWTIAGTSLVNII